MTKGKNRRDPKSQAEREKLKGPKNVYSLQAKKKLRDLAVKLKADGKKLTHKDHKQLLEDFPEFFSKASGNCVVALSRIRKCIYDYRDKDNPGLDKKE